MHVHDEQASDDDSVVNDEAATHGESDGSGRPLQSKDDNSGVEGVVDALQET
jgi:hypothetical protein